MGLRANTERDDEDEYENGAAIDDNEDTIVGHADGSSGKVPSVWGTAKEEVILPPLP